MLLPNALSFVDGVFQRTPWLTPAFSFIQSVGNWINHHPAFVLSLVITWALVALFALCLARAGKDIPRVTWDTMVQEDLARQGDSLL